jgi:hypothetical protein
VASTAEEGRLLLASWEDDKELSLLDVLGGDLSALRGSLFKTRSPALAVAWGEWVAILPLADASADRIEVQTFASEGFSQSRSLVVARDLLADLVGFLALGILLPTSVRLDDAHFARHAEHAGRPLFASSSSGDIVPARVIFEPPYALLTLTVMGGSQEGVMVEPAGLWEHLVCGIEEAPFLVPWRAANPQAAVRAKVAINVQRILTYRVPLCTAVAAVLGTPPSAQADREPAEGLFLDIMGSLHLRPPGLLVPVQTFASLLDSFVGLELGQVMDWSQSQGGLSPRATHLAMGLALQVFPHAVGASLHSPPATLISSRCLAGLWRRRSAVALCSRPST